MRFKVFDEATILPPGIIVRNSPNSFGLESLRISVEVRGGMIPMTSFGVILVTLLCVALLVRRQQSRTLKPDSLNSNHSRTSEPWSATNFVEKPPAWLTLPQWPHGHNQIEIPSVSRNLAHRVDLAENSCTCEKWARACRGLPTTDLRRICRHIAQAIVRHQGQYGVNWQDWTLLILTSMSTGKSFGVCRSFDSATFSNGEENLLAIYDHETGYADIYGEHGGFYGYSAGRNRWSWGEGPAHPLVLKEALRPWMQTLDKRYEALQRECARRKVQQQREEQQERRAQQDAENDVARFPLDRLSSPYRLQDFERIHPGMIQFRNAVTAQVVLLSRTISEESRQILESVSGLPPVEEGAFFHLRVDESDLLLLFNRDRTKVRVVFRRPLRKKVDYSHEVFYPTECHWGREGTSPPRALLIRGLIYDFLHGVSMEGDRIDYELSRRPYMTDWEIFKMNPLERAPYPPLP